MSRLTAPSREAILLRVDLADPQNRVRPSDEEVGLHLTSFDERSLNALTAPTNEVAPAVVDRLRTNHLKKTLGYVGHRPGRALSAVFHVRGAHDPTCVVHPDLRWLGLRPNSDELYIFGYCVLETERASGSAFLRAVQRRHFEAGYRRAYAYVYANDPAAVWLHRTTGWVEVGRVRERRLAHRLALVDGTFYWLGEHTRRPVWNR